MPRPPPLPTLRPPPLRLALALAIGALSLGISGCGPADCPGICEDTEFCPNGEDLASCTDKCQATETTAANARCTTAFQSFLDCMDGADDICAEDACVAEGLAYVECARGHCAANVGEAGCTPEPGRDCDAVEATQTDTGCVIKATCSDGLYVLTCAGEACVCAKEDVEQSTVPVQTAFCEAPELATRVAAARTACGWPAQ